MSRFGSRPPSLRIPRTALPPSCSGEEKPQDTGLGFHLGLDDLLHPLLCVDRVTIQTGTSCGETRQARAGHVQTTIREDTGAHRSRASPEGRPGPRGALTDSSQSEGVPGGPHTFLPGALQARVWATTSPPNPGGSLQMRSSARGAQVPALPHQHPRLKPAPRMCRSQGQQPSRGGRR